MKRNIVLAVIATAAMALSLVGCGVKVTNISVPDAATLEKGESITLDRKSTRLNSSHNNQSRMPSSA